MRLTRSLARCYPDRRLIRIAHQVDPNAGDFVPSWSSVPVHDWARRFLQDNRLVPIASLLETSGSAASTTP
jgi:hypothetical protein